MGRLTFFFKPCYRLTRAVFHGLTSGLCLTALWPPTCRARQTGPSRSLDASDRLHAGRCDDAGWTCPRMTCWPSAAAVPADTQLGCRGGAGWGKVDRSCSVTQWMWRASSALEALPNDGTLPDTSARASQTVSTDGSGDAEMLARSCVMSGKATVWQFISGASLCLIMLILSSCASWPDSYLKSAVNHSSQEAVAKYLGPPHLSRELSTGEAVWSYGFTNTGVNVGCTSYIQYPLLGAPQRYITATAQEGVTARGSCAGRGAQTTAGGGLSLLFQAPPDSIGYNSVF